MWERVGAQVPFYFFGIGVSVVFFGGMEEGFLI